MLPLRLHAVLTALACVSRVAAETVVSRAGRRAVLPCHSADGGQAGVEVCWGRGQPLLFTCRNTLLRSRRERVTYKRSHRYDGQSTWSGASLTIFNVRPSDAGFYHCRVQLPGLFNDQTFIVHLIVILGVVPSSTSWEGKTWSTTTAEYQSGTGTALRGSDVTAANTTEPVMELVQLHVHPETTLRAFIGNTIRLSFIIFIPAVLLLAAYKTWKSNRGAAADGRPY